MIKNKKGGIDEAVDDAITSKNDFNETLYAKRLEV